LASKRHIHAFVLTSVVKEEYASQNWTKGVAAGASRVTALVSGSLVGSTNCEGGYCSWGRRSHGVQSEKELIRNWLD